VQFTLPTQARQFRALIKAVEDVSLELQSGEAVGVVGESGSGKSTLARTVLKLVHAQSGRVVWMGRPLDELSAAELRRTRRDLQIIFQDPLASLDPRMTVAQAIAEPLELHRTDLDREARAGAVRQMLARVGLSAAHAGRYPHELSGGQCQRVGIARAMILEPRLLVCDEPLSSLDVSVQAQILSLLAALRAASGTSILFVSHNLATVRQLCDRVLVMYLGHALELAPSAALFARPLHPYTRALLEAIPIPDPQIQPARLERALQGELPTGAAPSGCVFRTRCAHATALCASVAPGFERVAEGRSIACHRWQELAP
jgi:oligopeptide transport system ATP-binding protein